MHPRVNRRAESRGGTPINHIAERDFSAAQAPSLSNDHYHRHHRR
jgi:hypothetical protein